MSWSVKPALTNSLCSTACERWQSYPSISSMLFPLEAATADLKPAKLAACVQLSVLLRT